jgi:PAS domain S-box-containing protein
VVEIPDKEYQKLQSRLKELEAQAAERLPAEQAGKRIESDIKGSEARYRLLFDSSNDVLVQIDTSGTIVELNQHAEVLSGYKKEEIIGRKISALAGKFSVQSLALMVANFAKRKLGFQVGAYEVESIGSAGQRLFFEINAVPLKDSAGKEIGELAILHDVTERKRAVEQLKEKVNDLKIVNDAAVGRELKLIELEKEINELLMELGRKPKFK